MPKTGKSGGADINSERELISLLKGVLKDCFRDLHMILSKLTLSVASLSTQQQLFQQKFMTALETLTDSVNKNTTGQAALTAAVNEAIIHIGSPGPTEAQLLSLATVIDQNTQSDTDLTAALVAAVTPPPPPPTP